MNREFQSKQQTEQREYKEDCRYYVHITGNENYTAGKVSVLPIKVVGIANINGSMDLGSWIPLFRIAIDDLIKNSCPVV